MIDFGVIDKRFSIREYKRAIEPSRIKRWFMIVSPAGYMTWAIVNMQNHYGMVKYINEINPRINKMMGRIMP